MTEVREEHPLNAEPPMLVTVFGIVMDVSAEQPSFVAHTDNHRVARNTVEKSYQGYFENVKSCRFNDFNFI